MQCFHCLAHYSLIIIDLIVSRYYSTAIARPEVSAASTARTSETALCPLLQFVLFISQICFWDHKYVFHLGNVLYHLVQVILNLVASMFLTLCPNLSNFLTSSHVPWEMSHMASLVYFKNWDFCIFFFVLYRIFFKFIIFYSKCPKCHSRFFPFLCNTFCINRLKKSLFSSFSFFFLPYQFLNYSIIKTLNVRHVISVSFVK